ncbi:DRGX protein [Vespula maculifrons]|uniref:DRGX protein n=1 Tax=Vespula maculifrons TaxID=7453 RepID=A0ABD2CCQ9_VESMC
MPESSRRKRYEEERRQEERLPREVGMFVVRVICPIKPRGGLRQARVSRTRRVDDQRGGRGVAEEIGKVLFSHESRILTPGGGTISPGGAGPPASPSSGHYRQQTHSPPLVKSSMATGNDKKHMQHYHCGVYGIKL